MKPEYLNSLKSGIKTAVIVFITALISLASSLMDALTSWSVDGNPPDLSALKGLAVSAVVALGLGVANALFRFIQAAGVPVIGALFDGLIGQIPKYQPPENAVDNMGDPNRKEN